MGGGRIESTERRTGWFSTGRGGERDEVGRVDRVRLSQKGGGWMTRGDAPNQGGGGGGRRARAGRVGRGVLIASLSVRRFTHFRMGRFRFMGVLVLCTESGLVRGGSVLVESMIPGMLVLVSVHVHVHGHCPSAFVVTSHTFKFNHHLRLCQLLLKFLQVAGSLSPCPSHSLPSQAMNLWKKIKKFCSNTKPVLTQSPPPHLPPPSPPPPPQPLARERFLFILISLCVANLTFGQQELPFSTEPQSERP